MIKNTQTLTHEELKFIKNEKHRKVGLILNTVGSSSLFLIFFLLLVIAILIIVFVKEYYLLQLVDKVENGIRTTIENLINTAIEKVNDKTNIDEIYNQIIETISKNGITLRNGTVLSTEDIKELFNKVLNEEELKNIISTFVKNGKVVLPEQLNLDFIKNLIKELELYQFRNWGMILLIIACYFTVVNLLNIILAARLIITKGKIAKVLFILTSFLSINLINWIGMLIFIANNKKPKSNIALYY